MRSRITTREIAMKALVAFVIVMLTFGALAQAMAEEAFAPEAIELTRGKSVVLNSKAPIKRLSLADPEVADIILLSPYQIYLTGKKAGATNLTLWAVNGRVSRVYDINITPDVAQLKVMLHRLLPAERNIMVMPAGESITLSGTVSNSAALATVIETAELYAPKKVTNLLSVNGVHQVMLEVKVAEIHRTTMEHLGVDLSYAKNGHFAFTMLTDLFALDSQGPLSLIRTPEAAMNAVVNPSRNGIFGTQIGNMNFTGFLDVLKQNGLVKILAEPTLICRSGEKSQFLAGGEIPVPVPQGMGNVAIEYKEYGVALAFTPQVLSDDRISLKVFPEVSELDYTNAINVSGFTIPALSTRRTSTVVELGDGQSFAIAGLLQNQMKEQINKYPMLGDIPILGTLFRSSQYQKDETELVIIVTPHLAKPLDMAEQTLPTDYIAEPSEFEFFIMGKMEGDSPKVASSIRPAAHKSVTTNQSNTIDGGMEGDFGHILQ